MKTLLTLIIGIITTITTAVYRLQSFRDRRKSKGYNNKFARWYISIKPEGYYILGIAFVIIILEICLAILVYRQNSYKKSDTTTHDTNQITSNYGALTDWRDGQIYTWKRLIDGKKWMTKNLNYKASESWCYYHDSSNCNEFGRLYTAKSSLYACPENWRLPTEIEWKQLAITYGGIYELEHINLGNQKSLQPNEKYKYIQDEDIDGQPSISYRALTSSEANGLSISLSGYRSYNGFFSFLGKRGYYWSDTKNNSNNGGWAYYFYNNRLGRGEFNGNLGLSCRCIQD